MSGSARRGVSEWLLACFIGTQPAVLQVTAPHLQKWLGLVFAVMGGFIGGAGVLVAHFAWTLMPQRPPRAMLVLVVTGVATVGLMSVINFALQSDFRWLLLAPPLVWAAAIVTYIRRD